MIKSEDVFYEKDELNKMMKPFLTENRVRGVMYYGKMDDFIDDIKLAQYQSFASHKGRVLVYGVGASYIHKGDTLIYCDLARWEIQLRYRKGMPNFKQDNDDEDVLKKIKRGFFIESPKMNLNLIQYIMQKHLLFLQMLKNIQLDL